MGCCVSTHDNDSTPLPKQSSFQTHPLAHEFPCVSKSPPRAEEEAVKEVLSETPKPRLWPNTPPPLDDHQVAKPQLLLLTPKKAYPERKLSSGYPDPCTPEAASDASEMCSFSESISTSTIKEEDDHQLYSKEITTSSAEVRQKVNRSHQGYHGNFSHAQLQQLHNCRNQGRSPARRRPEPSPPRRRNPNPGGPRKEFLGENTSSGRRSQSPGMRGHNLSRSPSARRSGPSPGRSRIVQGPVEVEGEEEDKEKDEVGLRRESEEWQGPKESLENPLVSLECFIFL